MQPPYVVAVTALHLVSGHSSHQPVAAHADRTVDAPGRNQDVDRREGPGPGDRVVVDRVHQGSIYVEHDGVDPGCVAGHLWGVLLRSRARIAPRGSRTREAAGDTRPDHGRGDAPRLKT